MPGTRTIKRRKAESTRRLERLRARAVAALRVEIGFVPADEFPDISLRKALADAANLTDPSHTPSSTRRAVRGEPLLIRMCEEPLLDAATERELFRLFNYLKFRANGLRATLSEKRPNEKSLDRIDQLMELATALRNRIVRANTRLVVSLVKKYTSDSTVFDELLSEGISCLINAAEKFDYSRGFRFSTYATRAITRDLFRSVQRRHRDQGRYISASENNLENQVEESALPERQWHQTEGALMQMFEKLDDRERLIVRARFGFERTEQKPTFSYIGQLLGVSKERVRQLEGRALQKLRDIAQDLQLEEMLSLAGS